MATDFLNAKVNDIGELILPLDDIKGRAVFFREFFKTPVGQRFAPFMSESSKQRIEQVIEKWFGSKEITIPMLSRVVQSLLDVKDPGVVPPKPGPSAPVVDNRPRDAQGRFLNEYEVWAGDANRSMKEIRARADREPA